MPQWITNDALYVAIIYGMLQLPLPALSKRWALNAINLAVSFFFYFCTPEKIEWQHFGICLGISLLSYAALRYYARHTKYYAVALLLPVAVLVFFKVGNLPGIIGFSYLTFRLSQLAFEMQTGKVTEPPSLADYLGFAFFPLTFLIGPISPYRFYQSSLLLPNRAQTPLIRSLGRILVGIIKLNLLAEWFNTLNFPQFWFDGYYHGINDFLIACICSALHLYFNFSGACDIIIGAAGILNIRVAENFNNPLMARNIQDFWNRTHMTLSHYFRDIAFMPGTHFLNRLQNGRRTHFNAVVMLMVTFLLLGLWHGVARNFLIMGALNGLGMSVFYLYTLAWKRFPAGLQRFLQTPPMRVASWALTMLFVSFTFAFFENAGWSLKQVYYLFRP